MEVSPAADGGMLFAHGFACRFGVEELPVALWGFAMHRPVLSIVPGSFPRIAFVVALTLLGLPISSAQGQATQPASAGEATELSKLDPVALREKAAEWRYQNAELKEKLANALSRIEKLESEVRRLRAYAPPTEAEAARAEKIGPMAAAGEKPAEAAAKSVPAAAEIQRSPYTNLFTLLQTLPTDVRPVPKTGWTREVLDKSSEWMNANLLGTKIDLSIVVTKVEVKDTKPINSHTPSDLWQVEINHQPIEFEYAITHVAISFFNSAHFGDHRRGYDGLVPHEHLIWKVDEATAKRFKALKPGQAIKLRGNIQQVLSTAKAPGRDCMMYFRVTDLAPL